MNGPTVALPEFNQRGGNGSLNFSRAIAAQFFIHIFQTPDQVENFPARIRAAGGGAKMRAAAERSVGVNQTAAGLALEERTCAVSGRWHFLASRRAKAFGRDERLAFGELRREAGKLKLATFRARLTKAFPFPLRQVRIHCPDFVEGALNFFPPH